MANKRSAGSAAAAGSLEPSSKRPHAQRIGPVSADFLQAFAHSKGWQRSMLSVPDGQSQFFRVRQHKTTSSPYCVTSHYVCGFCYHGSYRPSDMMSHIEARHREGPSAPAPPAPTTAVSSGDHVDAFDACANSDAGGHEAGSSSGAESGAPPSGAQPAALDEPDAGVDWMTDDELMQRGGRLTLPALVDKDMTVLPPPLYRYVTLEVVHQAKQWRPPRCPASMSGAHSGCRITRHGYYFRVAHDMPMPCVVAYPRFICASAVDLSQRGGFSFFNAQIQV